MTEQKSNSESNSLLSLTSTIGPDSIATSSLKPTMEAHQLPSECYPPTDSDDESFVVLETNCDGHIPSLPEFKTSLLQSQIIDESLEQASEAIIQSLTLQSLPVVPKLDASLVAKSFESVSTDELQQRIELLLEDNQKLSDSLNQNNIVMKNQFETLSQWQEDVERVHDSHKKKFAETKEYIKQLQKENNKLKKMVSSNSNSMNASIISKSQVQQATSQPQVAEKVQVQVEDVATSMDSLKLASANELQDLKDELQRTKDAHQEITDTLQNSCGKLYAIKDALQRSSDMNVSQEAEIKQLKEQLSTLTNIHSMQSVELFNIKSDLESAKEGNSKQSGEMDDLRSQLDKDKLQLTQQSNDVDVLKAEIQNLKQEVAALGQRNDAQKVQLEAYAFLEEELADYKKQVKTNDYDYKQLELENLEAVKKEQKLLEDVMSLKCQLLKMRTNETVEVEKMRIQLSSLQSSITDLKESKKVVEKEAELNRGTVEDLSKKLKEAQIDQDKIVALEQQLLMYRGDYESERELKIRAIEELNKVNDDLGIVQQRNHELVNEIEVLRQANDEFVEVQHPRPEPQNTPSPPLTQYSCPLCNQKFRSVRAVEEHIEMCIENAPP